MNKIRVAQSDCLTWFPKQKPNAFQLIVADPPYFQVQIKEKWDNAWASEVDYVKWMLAWLKEAKRVLNATGLLYLFGQLGKREHVFLQVMAQATKLFQFHDLIIWDRAVGYNERRDSFTPQYEMILVLRKSEKPYFNKSAVREAYDEATKQIYLKDKRYKNLKKRKLHLEQGKFATNLWRIPSLKGASKEKVGHPTQKPLALIERIILSSSKKGDWLCDPFLGSGTTVIAALKLDRQFAGCEIDKNYYRIAKRRLARESRE
ncbi:MAG: site-specific DNA-methyltransferase [Verrucomicrobiia bacterium]